MAQDRDERASQPASSSVERRKADRRAVDFRTVAGREGGRVADDYAALARGKCLDRKAKVDRRCMCFFQPKRRPVDQKQEAEKLVVEVLSHQQVLLVPLLSSLCFVLI